MEKTDNVVLKRLSSLSSVEISEFEPDIRSWNVLGEKGFRLGFVSDLWIDPDDLGIRYLEVDTEDEDHKKILLPVGMIALNKKEKFVVAVDIRKTDLPKIPGFTGDSVSRDYEVNLRKTYLPGNVSSTEWQRDFYNHNHFNEHNLFKERATRRKKYKRGFFENI